MLKVGVMIIISQPNYKMAVDFTAVLIYFNGEVLIKINDK
jgi:hypothetical protein